ncbi:Fur family transcriptional regulator [Limisalsivibrio acetivorans]|uniref:Fur family transcriptional regulator n=1 Tax=Limisalsivibrio acetivorans TaxID=1304888 RepID=UPI0003B71B7C|nr:Fur family transcriptional regulator [Limisalsivibrio acetivorans]
MSTCIARDLLRGKNLKVTQARERVLDVLLGSERPLNAKEVHSESESDQATVYRALSVLKESGLVREILGESGVSFYEKACRHNPVHPHFHCEVCGMVYCLDPLSFEDGLILGKVGEGFTVKSVSLDIKGVCSKCG